MKKSALPRFCSFVLYLFSFILFLACSEDGAGPKPKPEGYQEDIPWPSLADSPWPMYRHDPQNTGRGNEIGPVEFVVDWAIDSFFVASGVAIGEDSTLYFIEILDWEKENSKSGLVALNFDGSFKWRYEFPAYNKREPSSPLIAADGTIYTSFPYENKFLAINPDGTLKWEVETGSRVLQTAINIDKEGNLYMIGLYPSALIAISKEGNLLWSAENENFQAQSLEGMSFSTDGKILYIPGDNDGPAVLAYDVTSQSEVWRFGNSASRIPIVDSQDNIYLVSNDDSLSTFLISLDRHGQMRWKTVLQWSDLSVPNFTIDRTGNIYIGEGNLYCIDYFGNIKWDYYSKYRDVLSRLSPINFNSNNQIFFTTAGADRENRKLIIMQDSVVINEIVSPGPYNTYWDFSFSQGFGRLFIPGYNSRYLWVLK